MTEFRKARPEEAADILDFINYVFSEAHRPHDFKKFNPHMYDSDYPFWNDHYVASEDGRIRATVAVTFEQRVHSGIAMTSCEVGQVSSHPYHRGKGYMQALMNMAVADMEKAGADYAHLGGLRQRYEYFGFSRAECAYEMHITKNNCFHKKNEKSGAVTLDGDLILLDGREAGRFDGDRAVLGDWDLAPGAYAAFLEKTGEEEVSVHVKPYDKACLRGLAAFCESTALIYTDQIRMYNYEKFLLACLKARAGQGLAASGSMSLEIEGRRFTLSVKEGTAFAGPCGKADMTLTHMEAQDLFFSMTEHTLRDDLPRGWFPFVL